MKKMVRLPNVRMLSILLITAAVLMGALFGMVAPAPVLAAESAGPLIDLVFVIDNSGSMRKNDPKFITPKVVETFVRQLPESAQVGVVLFDQNARILSPMTGISGKQDGNEIISGLKKIDYRGQFTNTPMGMERAIYELKIHGRPLAEKGIVLITDGIVDTGNPKKDQELTQWLKKDLTAQSKLLGIRVFGIAFTENADFSLIQTLALRTGGEYFRTHKASEISNVLTQVQAHMTPPPKQELAPLPLIPVPEDETARDASAAAGPASGKAGENSVVVTGKSAWMISLTLVVVIVVLIGALVFFYIQNAKRKFGDGQPAEPDMDIPEAHLETLNQNEDEDESVTIHKLDKPRINIGRSQRNDIVIHQPAVSSFHATIDFRNMAFYLEDQRSTNGTQLNGMRLTPNEPLRLKSGDRITFAKYDFKFVMVDQIPFGETVMLSMTALADPEAEATVVLDLDGADTKQGLISCLQNHLMQIYGLGPKHKNFVNTYFAHDTLDIIATTAHENLKLTRSDNEQHCSPILKNKAYYVVCSLPAAIDKAADWYGTHHKGFTQFIFKWIRSERYRSEQCELLCIVTFGQDPATWVSITIVPTHTEADPVEIMSVDFLNDEEKKSLALDFDNHGRVI
jgi:pSer/pThr/pTyr-binding forkhead associated (FHA) protein/Mg-chelatase subunit ChlD